MIELPTATDFEIEAIRAGISIVEACKRARRSPKVWQRWKRGVSSPNLKCLADILHQIKLAHGQDLPK